MKRSVLGRLSIALTVYSFLALWSAAATPEGADQAKERITISNGRFTVEGRRIWINGANTPWHHWNDLGGDFDPRWWDAHLKLLHDHGINVTRIWISCSGDIGIEIDENGNVHGATPAYWADLGRLLEIARENEVYILATLMSFDNFKSGSHSFMKWRRWIGSNAGIESYVGNFLDPLLDRFGRTPRLWAIDLMNEPDWVFEDAADGKIPWERLQFYFARAASEIHQRSAVLVTIGMAMPKYGSSFARETQGNKIGDEALRAAFNDPGSRLDFNSTHYYDWCGPIWGNALYLSPQAYGLSSDRPSVIEEFPARGTKGHTVTGDYESAFKVGWEGAMGWTSNSVDNNGGISELGEATLAFERRHPDLVRPGTGR